jgi:two-component system phosphate regulon response regulator OmpR
MPYASWRVLCVDDHADSLELVSLILREGGFTVVPAASLSRARELIAAENFDAFVIDGRLPDGDGIDLCAEIRSRRYEAPIFVLSASVHKTDIDRARRQGATLFFSKPLEVDKLANVLKGPYRAALAASQAAEDE